jgi:hypothetical protein
MRDASLYIKQITFSSSFRALERFITPATIYIKTVIPVEAGIQNWLGCPRIKYGAGLSSPA